MVYLLHEEPASKRRRRETGCPCHDATAFRYAPATVGKVTAGAMTIEPFKQNPERTLIRTLTVCLCRIAGMALFVMGLVYWVRLIGIFDGPLWRFDLMPVWWRFAAPTLAVLYPVAGIGLWLLASWGSVIWVLLTLVEIIMHLGFPQLFGGDLMPVALNLTGLMLLAILRIIAYLDERRQS